MANEITINGIPLKEIRSIKDKISKGANEFISNSLDEVKEKMKILIGDEDKQLEDQDDIDIEALSKEIYQILQNVSLVASVCGVEYYLPVYSDNTRDIPYTSNMEDNFRGFDVWGSRGSLSDLYSLMESMEDNVIDWNRSYC